MKSNCIVIPARYKSTRLPGKPLIKINGEFLIIRTIKKILKVYSKKKVFVCTDSKKVCKIVKELTDVKSILIKDKCLNGTERCSKALKYIKNNFNYFTIISCDMHFLDPRVISFLEKKIKKEKKNVEGVTIHTKIDKKDAQNYNIAKIVLSKSNRILYLSRACIPNTKFSNKTTEYFSHHGLLILKKKALQRYSSLKNTYLQKAEENEWLKFIENDFLIKSFFYKKIKPEINTRGDLKKYFPYKFKLSNK